MTNDEWPMTNDGRGGEGSWGGDRLAVYAYLRGVNMVRPVRSFFWLENRMLAT